MLEASLTGKDTTSIHCIQSASYSALFLFRHSKSVINIHTNNKIWLIEAFSNPGYLGGEKKKKEKKRCLRNVLSNTIQTTQGQLDIWILTNNGFVFTWVKLIAWSFLWLLLDLLGWISDTDCVYSLSNWHDLLQFWEGLSEMFYVCS